MEPKANLTFEYELPGGQLRLKEMILYVCQKYVGANRFGKVKLNKILWRADFQAFLRRRVPVTGRSYQRLAAGPAPVEMLPLVEEMQAQGLLKFDRCDLGDGYIEDRPIALGRPNLRYFSQDDLSYIDASISYYWTKSASSASGLSHGVAWKTRADRDPMPYESVVLMDSKLTIGEKKKFGELAKARGWKSL